jgi:alpha-mannosidase
MVTALKGSEDVVDTAGTGTADLIVRAVETRGETGSVRLELPVVGRVIEGNFGPNQIRTFRVPRDPGAPVVEVNLVEWPLENAEVEEAALPGTEPEEGTTAPRSPEPEPAVEDVTNSRQAPGTSPRIPGDTVGESEKTTAK